MNTQPEHNDPRSADAAAAAPVTKTATSPPPEAPNPELHAGVAGARAGGSWDTRQVGQMVTQIQEHLLKLKGTMDNFHRLVFGQPDKPAAAGEPPHEPGVK